MKKFDESFNEVTKTISVDTLFVIYMGVVMTLADYIEMRDSL